MGNCLSAWECASHALQQRVDVVAGIRGSTALAHVEFPQLACSIFDSRRCVDYRRCKRATCSPNEWGSPTACTRDTHVRQAGYRLNVAHVELAPTAFVVSDKRAVFFVAHQADDVTLVRPVIAAPTHGSPPLVERALDACFDILLSVDFCDDYLEQSLSYAIGVPRTVAC